MKKLTIISKKQDNYSYNCISLDTFVSNLRSGTFANEKQKQICFAAQWQKRSGYPKLKEYNALVLLEIDNLPDRQMAEQVRDLAAQIPYTMVAYVGSDERSVKIACPAKPIEGMALDSEETMNRIQTNAFAKLHFIYTNQLQMNVENREPTLMSACSIGADKDAFYNENAVAMIINPQDSPLSRPTPINKNGVKLLPGMNQYGSEAMAFESCLAQAYDQLRAKPFEPDYQAHALASAIAEHCQKCGLPKMTALHFCRFKRWYIDNKLIVNTIFDNAYAEEELPFNPEKAMRGNQLLALKTENFVNSHYELRKNVLTDVIQYRDKKSYFYDWEDITDQKLNEITFKALKSGVGAKDKDIKRFIDSSMVKAFDPIADWLMSLPKWDGTDRVAQLADSIPTDNDTWKPFLHTWLLSMVAHWLGKDPVHGNAMMPVLIGYQGCGKTNFCNSLLPRELSEYTSNKVDLKSDTSIQLALSRYALINIDEFDQVKKGQQALLKFLISTSNAKMRLPLASQITERRRYASFIATTNFLQPLVDPTGSRRFICIKVTDQIKSLNDFNLPQLYAQLQAEVSEGARYWLNQEETQILESHNSQFMHVEGLQEIICNMFRIPKPEETGKKYTTTDIMAIIKQKLPNFKTDVGNAKNIGTILSNMKVAKKRTSAGYVYELVII